MTRRAGNDVAYIGVYYDTSITSPGSRGRSIYRAEWDSATSVWSVRQDMDGSYTSTGSPITASIYDLQISGDTV